MENFLRGFEKRAYDYGHEKRTLDAYHQMRSEQEPLSKTKGGLIGAGIGGGLGLIAGGTALRSWMKTLPKHVCGGGGVQTLATLGLLGGGALGGAALGGLVGVVTAIADKLGIERAKKIVSMPKDERLDYLSYLVRQREISQQQYNEWGRAFLNDAGEESRHRELMGALSKKAEESRHVDGIEAIGGGITGALLATHLADLARAKIPSKIKTPVAILSGIGGATVGAEATKSLRSIMRLGKKKEPTLPMPY